MPFYGNFLSQKYLQCPKTTQLWEWKQQRNLVGTSLASSLALRSPPTHTLAVRVSCYQELSSTHISEHPSSTPPPQKKSLLFPQQPTRGPFWHEQKRGNLLGAPHFDLIRKSKVRTFIFTPNSDSENQRSPWGRGTNLQYSFLFSQPAPSKVRTTVLSSGLEWTVTHPVPSTVSKMASVSFLSEQTTRMQYLNGARKLGEEGRRWWEQWWLTGWPSHCMWLVILTEGCSQGALNHSVPGLTLHS